ncbi:MAG TPA: hypothetical protein VMH86_07955 [Rhizomicrobium sp.]|nr:hypothetical protein [Rhizomicrobium sp.]
MLARFASKVLFVVIAAGLVWFGTGFAAYALWSALAPELGEAWAAAIVAFLLLVGPLSVTLALGARRRRRSLLEEEGLAGLFTLLARERPLMLLFGAALLGVAEAFLKKRK